MGQEFQTSAFNHFLSPQSGNGKLSNLKTNCFKIASYFMEWPGNPSQVLSELFEKFKDKDYCIMMLPRSVQVDTFFNPISEELLIVA